MTDTSIDAVVNPEDFGTGVTDGNEDYISAGFDALPTPNSGAILTGLTFTVDYVTPSFDLNTGVAQVIDSGMSVQSGSQTTYDTTVPGEQYQHVIVDNTQTGISLADGVVNEIWIAHDTQNQDSAYIRHGNGLSEPSDPSIKLGEIDTSADTKSEQWYYVADSQTLTFPSETAINSADVNLRPGTDVYDRSTDTGYVIT